ncbi:MAG: hypothetical protein ACK4VY_04070 [Brevundimonas sp.]
MSDSSARFGRFKQQAAGFAARIRPCHFVVAGAVLVLGVGMASAGAGNRPAPAPASDDRRLRIEVVAPVEPAIAPGGVMEVGHLVDGFTGVPRTPPRTMDVWVPDDEIHEDPPRSPYRPERRYDEAVVRPMVEPDGRYEARDPRRPDSLGRGFGFDAPERDYRAEREARRARREARERERDLRDSPRYWRDDDRY